MFKFFWKKQVEIDLITGAITILRSDLVYDCGMSLNPAVDLGQVFLCFLFFVFSGTSRRAAYHYIKVSSLFFLLYYRSFIFYSFNICFKLSFSLMQRYTALLMFEKNIFILEIDHNNKGWWNPSFPSFFDKIMMWNLTFWFHKSSNPLKSCPNLYG